MIFFKASLMFTIKVFLFILIEILEICANSTDSDSEVSDNVYVAALDDYGEYPYVSKVKEDWDC
jgi:hypothetical protein